MIDSYEGRVKKIEELFREAFRKNRHDLNDKAETMIRELSCKHLTPVGQELGEIASTFHYSDIRGPCLYTGGEPRGNSNKEYGVWKVDSKIPLDNLYRCSLTGDYCVARKSGFHSSDIPEGDSHTVYVEIDNQQRCPAYNVPNDLAKKLTGFRNINLEND